MTSALTAHLFCTLVITAAVYDCSVQSKTFLDVPQLISLEVNSQSNKSWLADPSTLQKQVLREPKSGGPNRKRRKTDLQTEVQSVMCQPRPTVVPLPTPPHGYTYIPHCVIVNRCSGCCSSRIYECASVKSKPIRKTVFKDKFGAIKRHTIRMEEDVKCACECKVKMKDCSPMQVYDENACACLCPNAADSDNCGSHKVWDPQQCKCVCRNSTCSTGNHLNEETCRCEMHNHLKFRRHFNFSPNKNDVLYIGGA